MAAIEALPVLLQGRAPRFVHGDLVPVNLVATADRTVAAILDLEDACLAYPLLDAAWFRTIVGSTTPTARPPRGPGSGVVRDRRSRSGDAHDARAAGYGPPGRS